MRTILILGAALALSGCATITDILAPPYVPDPIRIYKADLYLADVLECANAGKKYVPRFSFGLAATKVVDGVTANSSMIPFNPVWVPISGAAGGAVSAASDATDIMSGQHANVFRNCLHDETLIDGSAVLSNPN